ncbi:MAG TPA: S9 family peptidase [Bryobacteraceae bacterium]|nr:S9 family peptidase [Bryobacteraceae bacterium]
MRLLVAALAVSVCALAQTAKKPFDTEAMMRISRISEAQLSPDGTQVAFTVGRPDVSANSQPKQIYIAPVAGGTPKALTTEASNSRPRWTSDSKRIVFISTRGGTPQVWIMNADGSGQKAITTVPTGAGDVIVSRDDKWIVFTSEVYPDCADEACAKTKIEAEKNSKVKARVYTSLLYRHWTDWQGSTRRHLLVAPLEGGPAKDLTPGPFEAPTFSLGGPDDFAISPDGKELAYVSNVERDQSTSTNTDIFVVPIGGGEAKRVTLNAGADRSPMYSPDGKYIAFRSQSRAGYESDKWRLVMCERASGRTTVLNESQDRNIEEFTWSGDSTRLFYTVEDRGRTGVEMMPATGGASRRLISAASHIADVQFSPDGKTMIYSEQTGARPTGLFRASSAGGAAVPIENLNSALLAEYNLTELEEVWVENPNDKARIHSFVVKPPGFEAGRKYPMLLLIHGGPQGAWGHAWSYRWNAQVFAGAGYLVVMPNPRGSTGYGQKFTDDINQDWGGKPYDDLMAVVDHMVTQPYVDGERLAAAGASYGGYMVNWLLGHTDRFKAMVSHAGVFDLRSMAGETEELWFPIWEFNGLPWDNPDLYMKFSPSSYVKDFKTPTLVTHGELDYRVPVGQGMQLFTALQTQQVPSKFLVFPDEGHWILKPQNSMFWYRNFLEWVGEWTMKKPQVK